MLRNCLFLQRIDFDSLPALPLLTSGSYVNHRFSAVLRRALLLHALSLLPARPLLPLKHSLRIFFQSFFFPVFDAMSLVFRGLK